MERDVKVFKVEPLASDLLLQLLGVLLVELLGVDQHQSLVNWEVARSVRDRLPADVVAGNQSLLNIVGISERNCLEIGFIEDINWNR